MRVIPLVACLLCLSILACAIPVTSCATTETYTIQGVDLIGNAIITLVQDFYNCSVSFDLSHLDIYSSPTTNATLFIYLSIADTDGNGFGFIIKQTTTPEVYYCVDKLTTWSTKDTLTAYTNITSASETLPNFRIDYKDNMTANFYKGAIGSKVHVLTFSDCKIEKLEVAGTPSDAVIGGYLTVTVRSYSSTGSMTSMISYILPIMMIAMCLGLIAKFGRSTK